MRVAQVRLRVALYRMVQVRKLKRIPDKEHRRVITNEVPVALLRVELHGKSADIALRIGSTALPSHGGKTDEQLGLLPDLGEDFRLGEPRDVMSDRKRSECS